MERQPTTDRMIQEYVPGKQVTLAHLIANVGRQLFLHGSEMLQTHRQVNNDAAYGRFGDFALR